MLPTVNVTVVVNDQNGLAVSGALISARLDSPEISSGYVLPDRVDAVADSSGVAVLALWPNQLGATQSQYEIKIKNPKTQKTTQLLATIPNNNCLLHAVANLPAYTGKIEGQIALDAAIAVVAGINADANAIAANAASATASKNASALSASSASADAASALVSKADSALSASSALTSKNDAAASSASALASKNIATTNALDAIESKNAAAISAASALASRDTAVASSTSASASKDSALASAASAQSNATSLATSAASALSSKDTAVAKAAEAKASADAAAISAMQASSGNLILSVAGRQGVVVLAKGDVGLGSVDNTPDADKPVSAAQLAALNLKANLSDVSAGTPVSGGPSSATYTYVGGVVTQIVEVIKGVSYTSSYAYNPDGTVTTITTTGGGKTRTETYTYAAGVVTGFTATEI